MFSMASTAVNYMRHCDQLLLNCNGSASLLAESQPGPSLNECCTPSSAPGALETG
jgi:hypothetical protein